MNARGKSVSEVRGSLAYRVAFSASVAAIMSALIGGAIAFIRAGPDGALSAWISTAPIAFGVALPTSFFVVPFVQTRIDRLFGADPDHQRKD
jgi:hypothetical protein